MKNRLLIANGQGFWGDTPSAPTQLAKNIPELDYLTLDYLSEVSMSILAIQREKDPHAGFAKDFLDVIKSLVPYWNQGHQIRVLTNAGGLNPEACSRACQKLLKELKCSKKIATVSGDNVLATIKSSREGYVHLDTHAPINTIKDELMTANAYLGAQPIAEAIQKGADIIITGRVADPSLTVGPVIAHFGNDLNLIASATIAGHLIECGTQVTGGISTNWLEVPEIYNIGFPYVEMHADGSFIISKAPNTGGVVSIETVKEQLLYEISDPENYLSPDATVSFLDLSLEEIEKNRILLRGAKGKPPPSQYKVSATYRKGFKAEGHLALFGGQLAEKAKMCGEIVYNRVKSAGYALQEFNVECIGINSLAPGILKGPQKPMECALRISAADSRYEALEAFSKEIAGLVTAGPQGTTGYMSGRPSIRPVFGFWPCLIDRKLVSPKLSFEDEI